MIERRVIVYPGPGGPFEGVFACDSEAPGRRPGLLVIPNILGQKEADNDIAAALAHLGYAALACDLYGRGKRTARGSPDVSRYMDELNADRMLLRDRLAASLDALSSQDEVDSSRLAAVGYCFGGKCVLDMARAGLGIRGGISFHGVYDRPEYATIVPIKAKLLICHGWDDPLGAPDKVVALAAELTQAQADWQIHAYGHTGHSFTDQQLKGAGSGAPGFGYRELADRRSWTATKNFLGELLN